MIRPHSHLRDYQKYIQTHVVEAWKSHKSIMLQMPTGTGKTHLLASIIYDSLKENGKRYVWIVAHRRELVEQIEETMERYGIPSIPKEDGRVRAMSIQWLSRHLADLHETPNLIVIDEAHHALAKTYKELWLRHPEAKKLGLTATPCRLNRRGFTDLFDELITSDSITDFIRQGWLSTFDYVSIRPGSKSQRLIDNLSKRGADGDFQTKEMNEVLNCRPCIEQLYESVRQYADEKKGIVYAISISHARNIADFYRMHGINTVAIDSKTPARLRKQFIEDFKRGKTQVLVNVDVFSEGFDCPDVEFVQMARPTLSLAKYLQQVGRGLRKAAGKDTCMLIDNVGLYRLFGLPTAYRDWKAMFEGRLAGKGYRTTCKPEYMAAKQEKDQTARPNGPLEMVMSHELLWDYLNKSKPLTDYNSTPQEKLKPFKDRQTGLWGLKCGQTITAKAQYPTLFDVKGNLAAVRFEDYRTGIVDKEGKIRMKTDRYKRMKFLPDDIVAVTDRNDKTFYIDLRYNRHYMDKPVVMKFGQIEILQAGRMFYSRTKRVYVNRSGIDRHDFFSRGFYLLIYDPFITPEFKYVESMEDSLNKDYVCILENDEESYYRFCGELPDGSIVIVDGEGRYYHAEAGKEKTVYRLPEPRNTNGKLQSGSIKANIRSKGTGHSKASGQTAYARKETERTVGHLTKRCAVQVRTEMGTEVGRAYHRTAHLPPHPKADRLLLCNGRKPEPVGYHHVGRESRGRSPIYERGNKRQRDGLPDYHTGKDKDRKAINRSAGKYAPNKKSFSAKRKIAWLRMIFCFYLCILIIMRIFATAKGCLPDWDG